VYNRESQEQIQRPIEVKWEAKYRQLQEFLEKNQGRFPYECDSSTLSGDDQLLRIWCRLQRFKDKQHKERTSKKYEEPGSNNEGDHSSESSESRGGSSGGRLSRAAAADQRIRIQMNRLQAMGFNFELLEDQWTERYDQLKRYVELHGHSMVPRNYADNLQLGSWVMKQR
jgi:Helicase associated domain